MPLKDAYVFQLTFRAAFSAHTTIYVSDGTNLKVTMLVYPPLTADELATWQTIYATTREELELP